MSPGEENRLHPRVPLVLQVEYPDREGFLSDSTENLSAGGAFVRTDLPLKVGDRIPMVLSFPGLLPRLEIVGEVMWIRPHHESSPRGVGIQIPNDRPHDKKQLEDLMARVRSAQPAARRSGFRIMLVEDNPHLMEMYEYVMKKLAKNDHVPVEVVFAKDGHDALSQIGKHPCDLVVTDLYMPVLDGFGFIQRLRAQDETRGVPVIAISGGGADAQASAKSAGANVYLRKPVRFLDVLETVRALLKL